MKFSRMELIAALTCSSVVLSSAVELPQPSVWDADDMDQIVLTMDWLEIDPGFGGPPFSTRVLGGSAPGPTIKVSAGTTLKIKFQNKLQVQQSALSSFAFHELNQWHKPDTANLHFHGGHVTSVLPGDDTTLAVPPGEEYEYEIPIPADHMPGIHWIHAHHHGSTSLHLGGGAACAFIVKDPPGYLKDEIANAMELVLVMQDWDINGLIQISKTAGDLILKENLETIEGGDDIGRQFVTVNGQYIPTLTMERGVWYRWRMVYAGWQDLLLNFKTIKDENQGECEMQLLAKDGIYLQDFPREVSELPIPAGGRADVMVRCHTEGTAAFEALGRRTLVVQVVAETSSEEPSDQAPVVIAGSRNDDVNTTLHSLTPWTPLERPDYLQDLSTTVASSGCACTTELLGYDGESAINGIPYQPGNFFLHTSYLGAVNERVLIGMDEHSYHQHIYPFQLIAGFEETDYLKAGDWHDTVMDNRRDVEFLVRYRTTVIAGKLMVHCHNAMHADRGMLAKEYVRGVNNGECKCNILGPIEGAGIVDDVSSAKVVGGGALIDKSSSVTTASSFATLMLFCLWLSLFEV